MPNIQHVVVLMLENRSFDHILGLFPNVDGVLTQSFTNLFNPAARPSASNAGFSTGPGATFTTVGKNGPSHSLDGTSIQIFGNKAATGPAQNNGFVLDYESALRQDRVTSTPAILGTIMKSFEIGELPAIHALAQEFAICDRWFSEVPGPTMPNRCYIHAATSTGFAHNNFKHRFGVPTIYNRLQDKGKTWSVYFTDDNDVAQYDQVNSQEENFHDFSQFDRDARAGALPNYTFIMPQFNSGKDGSPQNSMHAPSDMRPGDSLVADVYEALRANEDSWNSTLFILTFDEHGGFFDHVIPPEAVSPDEINSPAPDDEADFKLPDFDFKRLGLRVPTILASPFIAKGTVISDRLQHTSVLATLHELWGTEPLTHRDAAAASFLSHLQQTARRDTPLTLPRVAGADGTLAAVALDISSPGHPANQPLDDVQQELVDGWRGHPEVGALATAEVRSQGDAHEFLRNAAWAVIHGRARAARTRTRLVAAVTAARAPAPAATAALENQFAAAGVAEVLVFMKDGTAPRTELASRAVGLSRHFRSSDLSHDAALLAALRGPAGAAGLASGTGGPRPAVAAPAHRFFPHLGIMYGTVDRVGLSALQADEGVAAVHEAPRLSLIRPIRDVATTQRGASSWGLERLRILEVWEAGFKGKGILVGHLDTGVDSTHPALKGAVAQFAEFDLLGHQVPNAPAHDSGRHGTHTAGTIAGRAVGSVSFGVAPEATLASALVIEGGNVVARILGGMDWVVGQGARVLSMSLGLPGFTPAFLDVTRRLRERNVLPVFAVGNEGPGTSRSPGNYAEALSVGAMDEHDDVADFSSSQRFQRSEDPLVPDLVAPGVDIASCVPGGGFAVMSGTSMATPHVAGLAALLFQAKPAAGADEVERAIFESCHLPASMDRERANRGVPDAVLALRLLLGSELPAAAEAAVPVRRKGRQVARAASRKKPRR
jgi:phospholipase C/subtilisin family serine protease